MRFPISQRREQLFRRCNIFQPFQQIHVRVLFESLTTPMLDFGFVENGIGRFDVLSVLQDVFFSRFFDFRRFNQWCVFYFSPRIRS